MRGLVLVVLIIASIHKVGANQIKWHTVLELANETNNIKPIYLYVTSGGDYFTQKFESETLVNQDVIKLVNEHYYAVKLNPRDTSVYSVAQKANGGEDLFLDGKKVNMYSFWQKNKLRATPAHLFLEPNYHSIHTEYGYKPIDEFEILLNYYSEQKQTEEFEDYRTKFKLQKAITAILTDVPNNFKNIKGAEDKELTFMTTTAYNTNALVPNSSKCHVFDMVHGETYKTFYQYRAELASKVTVDSAYKAMDQWKELLAACDFRTTTKASMVVRKDMIKSRTDVLGQAYFVLVGPAEEYKHVTIKLSLRPELLEKDKVSLYFFIENAPDE
ncbi:MAG: hypothetical protein KDC92_09115 [Bacteroidetes bacterium]|nr:hypothetical protein [Bacteroidota bacterium]